MEKIYYQTLKETLFHEKLENGLEVYLLPKIGFEKTYGLFSTRFGSIDTTFVPLGQKEMIKVEDGIAHFLEHKMFDMENGDAADEFAKLGASSNAFTSSSRTAYLFSTTTNENDCVELLLDFVQSLNITDESVEKEKGIICQEIKMYDDIPEEIVHEKNIEYALRGIHSNSISGTVSSLKKIDRKAILNYLEKHYVAENLVIVVAGNIDEKYLYKELNKKMKDFRKAKKKEVLDLTYEIKKGKKVVKKPSNQIHLCFTTKGVSSKSDLRYPAAIISNILGEGMSSRLFQKIREERGLAYSVYTYLTRFENCGLLSVYVGTTKEDYKEVIKLIKEEFNNIKENGISERELRKAKNKYESAFTFSLESTSSRMNRLASTYITYRKIISLDKVREDIEKVTLKDIKKAAEFLFDEQFYSQTIVGDI